MKIDCIELEASAERIFLPYIESGGELVLVDAGYPGMAGQIEEKLRAAGRRLSEVTQIWITHHDYDHVGSLAEIKSRHPGITVRASAPERPYIEGAAISLRLRQAIDLQDSLPEAEQEGGLAFQAYLRTIEPCKVDAPLTPGEAVLDRQIQILDTFGHTEGHLAFYDPAGQTLIAGDAVFVEGGVLEIPLPEFSFDLARARAALLTISALPVTRVICCHGGILTGSAAELKAKLRAAAHS